MADRPATATRVRIGSVVGIGVAMVLGVLALAALALQVEVSDAEVGATRACGSAFDALADRSGWETWWAGDLEEPDEEIRSALVRTTRCPDAVNARIVVAAMLGATSALAALAVLARRRHDGRRDAPTAERARARLGRLGRITTGVGAVLTLAGAVAVVLLVADADSTLFLYTDRFVVAVVGLIVLVPTIALVVIGRAVTILADTAADRRDRADADRAQTDAS